jgi:hypothetical protein
MLLNNLSMIWFGMHKTHRVLTLKLAGIRYLLQNVKDRNGEPERGESEWEPIKILFKNSAYEPDFTRAPPQASLVKFTQPLKCY